MKASTNPMHSIETHARDYREAKDVLVERARALHEEIEAAKGRAMRGLRAAAAALTDRRDALTQALQAHPQLFIKPRSIVLHGVKVGFAKGAGKVDWDDDDQVVRLIRKHLPEQFDVLVKTTERPVKDALKGLTGTELKRIGVQVEGTGDVVVIADTTAAVNKLVKALLKSAEEEVSS